MPILSSFGGGSIRGFRSSGGGGPLYDFSSHTFTDAGAGSQANNDIGPTQSQLSTAYSSVSWYSSSVLSSVLGGIQQWTVPSDGSYRFTVAGAAGSQNGRGRVVRGTVSLSQGDILYLLVGQRGDSGHGGSGCGGGGSWVSYNNISSSNYTSRLLFVGGGGGGGASTAGNAQGQDNNNGGPGGGSDPGAGGTSGNTGGEGSNGAGGSGGSFFQNGTDPYGDGTDKAAAKSFLDGTEPGRGGRNNTQSPSSASYRGGFGGGASAGWNSNMPYGYTRPGAGGGFSGGGAGSYHDSDSNIDYGGGGGSWIVSTASSSTFTHAFNTGQGYISVELV